MRKIFWFEMATLDGYHETLDSGLDWHTVDAEFMDFAFRQLREADTLLFGRRTYEHMASFWPTEAGPGVHGEIAEAMNSLPKGRRDQDADCRRLGADHDHPGRRRG